MNTSEVIAEREWLAVSPDDKERRVVLRVSRAEHRPRGEWICSVSVDDIDSRTHEIAGMDSWQAVELAMHFVAKRIIAFQRQGWKFYWDEKREPALPTDLCRGVIASGDG